MTTIDPTEKMVEGRQTKFSVEAEGVFKKIIWISQSFE